MTLNIISKNGKLFLNEERFHLKGLNWFGFETSDYVVHGLWQVSMDSLFDFITKNKFNAIRIPFSVELALNPLTKPKSTTISYKLNMDLINKTALEILDLLIDKAANRGIVILLDQHRLAANDGISELWTNSTYPEDKIILS